MKHMGNFTVTADNVHSFPAVEEFFGHLTIGPNVHLIADRLTMLRGWITLASGADVIFSHLGKLDGWLVLGQHTHVTLPNVADIVRDVVVDAGARLAAPKLTTVGNLLLLADALVALPSLQDVREGVSLKQRATANVPMLRTVRGSITLAEHARLGCPLLNHIGAYYDADPTALMVAPQFLS